MSENIIFWALCCTKRPEEKHTIRDKQSNLAVVSSLSPLKLGAASMRTTTVRRNIARGRKSEPKYLKILKIHSCEEIVRLLSATWWSLFLSLSSTDIRSRGNNYTYCLPRLSHCSVVDPSIFGTMTRLSWSVKWNCTMGEDEIIFNPFDWSDLRYKFLQSQDPCLMATERPLFSTIKSSTKANSLQLETIRFNSATTPNECLRIHRAEATTTTPAARSTMGHGWWGDIPRMKSVLIKGCPFASFA